MRQISVSQFTTCYWTFEEDLLRYQALGFDSVGLWRQKIDDFGHRNAVDLLYESKMNVSSLSWAGGFTGSDGHSHVEALEDAFDAIALASKIGAGSLIVHPGARNKHTNSHAFRLLESALSRMLPIAEDYGVKLSIELIPGFVESPWTFVHSFAQVDQLLDMFPAERLGLVLDLYHVGLNQPTLDRLQQFSDRIDLVQIADRTGTRNAEENRLLLGEGNVDIAAWISKLDAMNFDGPIELELHGSGVEGIDYFERLDHSLDFMQQQLASKTSESTAPRPTASLRTPE